MSLSETDAQFVSALQEGRYIAAVIVLAALWAAESVAPMYAPRSRRVSHGLANLGLAALNAGVAHGFAFGVVYVTEYSRAHRMGLLHQVSMPG